MNLLKRNFSFLNILVVFASANIPTILGGPQKLLVLMIDGFRWDYYENLKEKLPGFNAFTAEGVHSEWVFPIFPSETFPSMTTIATGVFPENHGILVNYLMNRSCTDPDYKYLTRKYPDPPNQWIQVEPIWITTTKHGKKTYVADWPFSFIPYEGLLPEKFKIFNSSLPNEIDSFKDELDKSLNLLADDFSFVMQYYGGIDFRGHLNGPGSTQVQQRVIALDEVLQKLFYKIENSDLSNKLNVIMVSDHGMTRTGLDSGISVVYLKDYISEDCIDKIISKKITLLIAAVDKYCIEKLYLQLKSISFGVDVYKKEDIPDDLHYKDNEIMLDILLTAQPGYIIQGFSDDKQIPEDRDGPPMEGNHGYLNFTDMRAVFFAKGPAFKKGYIHTPIHLEDEYQIFAKILEVPALPNNGSWARVASLFI